MVDVRTWFEEITFGGWQRCWLKVVARKGNMANGRQKTGFQPNVKSADTDFLAA